MPDDVRTLAGLLLIVAVVYACMRLAFPKPRSKWRP
jgi:hypothetical protein